MKSTVTKLEGLNEAMNFTLSFLGNYFLETDFSCYAIQRSSLLGDTQYELLRNTQTNENDCNMIDMARQNSTNIDLDTNIWTLYFDGSNSQEGTKA